MKTDIKVTLKTKKVFDQIIKRLNQNSNKELRVGFFREDTYDSDNENLPVAQVASWNEFGHANGGLFAGSITPPRPFMRVGLRSVLSSSSYKKVYSLAFQKIIQGKTGYPKVYDSIAGKVVPDLQKVIDEWISPPNSPTTEEIKGTNDPLVDTGKMRDSVKAKVATTRKGKNSG